MSSILDSDTVLSVDVGSVNTRANLFDVVDGRYRLVATGRAPSTAGAPFFDIREGVRVAFSKIQTITGRRFMDESEALIMPVTTDGVGVDTFVTTTTAGPKVRTILVGLMPDVSMESIRRLAATSYLNVLEEISLMDRRQDGEQIDIILNARPDLILLAGGTDGGAVDSVLRLVESVGIATRLLPTGSKPHIVYAGNRQLAEAVKGRLGSRASVVLTSNLRPSLEEEDLGPARLCLAEAIAEVRSARVSGFDDLAQWSGGNLMLTTDAFGRVVGYLSQIYSPDKGVLGIDLGASQTTITVAFEGNLNISVQSDMGMGGGLPGIFKHNSLDDIKRWLPIEIADSQLQDYIYNKALYPRTIPTEMEELHLEYVLARQVLYSALSIAREGWPAKKNLHDSWLMPALEPIIVSGGTLARAPRPGYVVLTLLDAIQPTGISTLVLDPHNLTPALGVAAGPLPIITVQVLESGSYVSLGTVVSPVGRAKIGKRILRVRLERENGGEDLAGEIRMGQLVVIPLAQGEHARLTLQPDRGIDAGLGGPGKAGTLRVAGGAVGLIIDARGRPLLLSNDPGKRREMNHKWLWDVGALG